MGTFKSIPEQPMAFALSGKVRRVNLQMASTNWPPNDERQEISFIWPVALHFYLDHSYCASMGRANT